MNESRFSERRKYEGFSLWSPILLNSCQIIKLRYEKVVVLQLRLGEGRESNVANKQIKQSVIPKRFFLFLFSKYEIAILVSVSLETVQLHPF